MPIEQLDVVPSRYRPTTFTADMENFLAWMARNVPNYNALEQSLQLVATTGTSTTSLTIGTGSKTLTTQPGKAWAVGAHIYVVSAASVTNIMIGQVTAYNSSTGSLTVNVVTSSGAGTLASWVIGLSAPQGSSASYTGYVSAAGFQLDAFSSLYVSGGVAYWVYDSGDSLYYDRTTNTWGITIGGAGRFYVDGTDGPQRTTDASTSNGLVRKAQMDAAVSGGPVLGAFRALTASATGTSATVSVATDEIVVASAVNAYATLRGVSLSINSAGSGANGLDTGSLAANTWYSVWVIHDGTNTAGLLSLSASAPTMPGGYTYKARVGWIRTDGTGNKYPLSFTQYGRTVQWRVAAGSNVTAWPQMATPMAWGPVGVSAFSPPSASSVRVLSGSQGNSQNASVGPNSTAASQTALLACGGGANYFIGMFVTDIQLESSNIYFSGNAVGLSSIGYEDNL